MTSGGHEKRLLVATCTPETVTWGDFLSSLHTLCVYTLILLNEPPSQTPQVRRERERKAMEDNKDLPFGVYLLFSSFVVRFLSSCKFGELCKVCLSIPQTQVYTTPSLDHSRSGLVLYSTLTNNELAPQNRPLQRSVRSLSTRTRTPFSELCSLITSSTPPSSASSQSRDSQQQASSSTR